MSHTDQQPQYRLRRLNRVTPGRNVKGHDGATREQRPDLHRGLVRGRYTDTDLRAPVASA